MPSHPSDLGFNCGIKVRIGRPAELIDLTEAARNITDVVYVALIEEGSIYLKVGETKNTLWSRWNSTLSIFGSKKLRPNEESDRDKWLLHTNGRVISVWFRQALKTEIPYARNKAAGEFSIRRAEEEFLDQYYRPILGAQLNRLALVENIT